MPLTEPQYAALNQDVTVTNASEFQDEVANNDYQALADAYNLPASPDFWVMRTLVTKDEYLNQAGPEGTTFTMVGNWFITRAQGERDAWRELFDNETHSVNAALPRVQQAFADIFSGTGNAANNLTHIKAQSRRLALRGERLYATGTGAPTTPGTLVVEGELTYWDMAHAVGGVALP